MNPLLFARPLWAGILCAGVLVGACSSTPDLPPLPAVEPADGAEISALTIGPGDELELRFFYTPELDTTQVVQPDGRLSAPLLGQVEVAGSTPEILEQTLADLYGKHLKSPAISVVVRNSFSRRVFVGGYVRQPGAVPMPAQLSVLEAILQAGGFDNLQSEPKNVVVLRHSGDQRMAYLVDLENAWREHQTTPFMLQPGDIVRVPQSKIAQLDQWVDQHINRLIPQVGLRYSTSVGSSGAVGIGAQN